MIERIKEVRTSEGLSMKKFGERLGVSASTIALIESGERNATDRFIRDICREFNIKEEWIRNGSGEMKASITKEKKIADLVAKLYGTDENSFEFKLAMMLKDMPVEDWQKVKNFIRSLSDSID